MHTADPPVIHLDIKPANILVSSFSLHIALGSYPGTQVQLPSLHIHIADFGLATSMCRTNVFGTATMRAGTPGFQAPEQLMGLSLTDKCDVYAFGGVMTELFGERPLWEQETPYTITFKVACNKEFPKTNHLETDIKTFVDSLCFTQEESRADSLALMRELLDLQLLVFA